LDTGKVATGRCAQRHAELRAAQDLFTLTVLVLVDLTAGEAFLQQPFRIGSVARRDVRPRETVRRGVAVASQRTISEAVPK
jgi:hypothetical protein